MDPVCHTLVGACLGRTGLARRTGLGMATLVLAANLPDVDVIAIAFGRNVAWRRGWTHGVPALLVWPFVLAALMWAWSRWRPRPDGPPVRPRVLLALAALGVLTHPFLDYLNTYGMRWLMPVQDRWYYGDSLFIVDPILSLLLGAGSWLAGRNARRGAPRPERPARVGLALASCYVGLMMLGSALVRARVGQTADGGRVMVAPVPIDPFRRRLVVDDGDRYRVGEARLLDGGGPVFDRTVGKGADRRAIEAIRSAPGAEAFLHWARFPVFGTERRGDSLAVRVYDLRYAADGGESWAGLEVMIPAVPPG